MRERVRECLPARRNWLGIVLGILSLAGLYGISRYNFLAFHCLAEAFSIVIAIAVCVIYWNTRHFLDYGAYLIIGLGCVFGGTLDLIYVFSYPGMSVFPVADGNMALQAKTVAQWYVAASCVGAVPFLRRKVNLNLALLAYGVPMVLAVGAIFFWRIFPDCYVEGVGITPFARAGLAVSCGGYLATLLLIRERPSEFDSEVFALLVGALIAFFVQDLTCAVATEMNGFARTLAHLCQVVAIFFVYKAFVVIGLTRPYDVMFRTQQQSAEALRNEKAFSDTIIDSIPGPFYVLDRNGRLNRWNRAYQEVVGLPAETLPGRDVLVRVVEDDRQLVAAKVEEVFEKGQAQAEARIFAKNEIRQFLLTGRRMDVGPTSYLVGSGIDITDRKRAEEALRTSEERYRGVVEDQTEVISRFAADGTFTFANDVYCRFFAKTSAELLGTKWHPVAVSEDLPRIEEQLRALSPANPVVTIENRVYSGLGLVRWMQFVNRGVFDDAGRLVEIQSVGRDITERIQAEQTLRASEERYRLLVETIPQLAWRASPDGLQREWNRRWYQYTGQTPAEVGGHGWLAAVHPQDVSRVGEQALRAVRTREPHEIEYRLRRAADGSYRWHLARAVPVRGEDGQVMCWIGSATDIEDLKQAQEMLKQTHDEELQRHRAELAHVGRLSMMGEMAATLAHELNQPLHAVKNYASGCVLRLRKRAEKDEELVAVLGQISEEASRAAEIIRRVIGFVQKREPRFGEVLVNNLVDEAVLLVKAELEQRHAKIVFELCADLPAVIGDPIQVEQVLMNLVRNGLEAMDQTPVDKRLLVIRTLRQGDDRVGVEVCDCGKGIDGADLERVFEPFVTTKPEGMGMGLAISRSIIQAHGGRLWGSVNPAAGCTFHFTLPVGSD